MSRLAGARPCETKNCQGRAFGNTRWCKDCRAEMAGICKTPGCEKPLKPSEPSYCQSCQVSRRQGEKTDAEIAEWRELMEGWDKLVRRRAMAGNAWWWR